MRTFATKMGSVDLTISSVDSLITVVPYLLGFVPTRSVVCIWTIDQKISLTMRVDLPAEESDFDLSAWARQMLSHGTHSGAMDIHIIIFDECWMSDSLDSPSSSVHMHSLVQAASRLGLQIDTLVTIFDSKRFEYECTECELSRCSGHDVTQPASDLRKLRGLLRTPAASREEVIAEINEVPNAQIKHLVEIESDHYAQLRAVNNCKPEFEKWRDESIALIRRAWGDATNVSDSCNTRAPQLARSVVALNDIRCRDSVLWVAARPEADLQQIGDFFARVATSAPIHLVAGPASVLAAVRWLQGDGLRATAACKKALEGAPDYSLALLIEAALSAGLPPEFWLDTMRGLTYEQCRARRRQRSSRPEGSDAAKSA